MAQVPNTTTPGNFSKFEYYRRNISNTSSDYEVPIASTFSGADYTVYFNDRRVANLEALTWSSSRESIANFGLGDPNAHSVTKGKRIIVGSMTMTVWARHALLGEVFNAFGRRAGDRDFTLADILRQDSPAAQILSPDYQRLTTSTTGAGSRSVPKPRAGDDLGINSSVSRGLSFADFQTIRREQVERAVNFTYSQRLKWADQLPPFDITLVGANEQGDVTQMSLLQIHITQETGGASINDLGNSTAFSFIALNWEPPRRFLVD